MRVARGGCAGRRFDHSGRRVPVLASAAVVGAFTGSVASMSM
jgi:hypothetical protein